MLDSSDQNTLKTENELIFHGAQGFFRISIVVVLFLGVLAIFMLILTNRLRSEQTNDSVRMKVVMDVQVHLSEFHLWLEEFLAGDANIDIDMVFRHLEEAEKDTAIIMDGGVVGRGERLKPTDDPLLIEYQVNFLLAVTEISELARVRVANAKESGIGTPIDEQFDAIFKKALQITEDIESILEEHEIIHAAQFNRFFWVILFTWLGASIAAVIIILRMERRRALLRVARDKAIGELRESEERFRISIEAANDAIFFADIETGIITGVNSKACELLGREQDEIIGIYQSELHPKEEADRYRAIFEKAAREGSALIGDVDIVRKDGSRVPVEISSSVIDIGGKRIIQGIFHDITKIKHAEGELRLTQFALDHAPDAIYWMDPNGRFLYVNEMACRTLGYSREELLSMGVGDIDPNLSEGPPPEMTQATKEAGGGRIETEHRKKDGTIFPVEVMIGYIEFEGKEYHCSFVRDITERKRVEEALKDSESRHKKAQEITHLGHWSYDPETDLVEGSDELFNIFNIDPCTLALEIFVDLMHPDDRENVLSAIRKSIESGEPYNIKYRLLLKGEIIKWVHAIGEPISDKRGKVVQFVGTLLDITENKEVENKLKENAFFLKESQRIANLGTYVFDIRNGTWRSSAILDDIFGIDDTYIKDVDGWLSLVCPDDREELARYLSDEVIVAHGSFDKEYCILRDGKKRLVHGLGELEYDANGEVLHMIGTIQDITERKEMEGELLKTEKLESLGILAGGIAHDFNNLLGTILGNVSYAKGFADPEDEIYTSMRESEKAIFRARDLTEQLLTFSRGGAPVKKVLLIGELIKEAARFGLMGSNVELELHISPDLKAVEIDEGQLNQVIHNIIINACHAMPTGGVAEVRADNKAVTAEDYLPVDDGDYIKISIEDNGIGIAKEFLSKIFDPFFTTKQMGSGLGLATAYTIIKNHHGHIGITSEVGKGTTFVIYLPVSKEMPPEEKNRDEIFISGEGRVLVMDDEEQLRELTCKILRRLGYSAESAKDGSEAIDIYRKALESGKGIDIVILDLTIPGGMGGKVCISELLKIDPEVKAIVSSGYSTDRVMSEYKKYGFKGYIEKPYTMEKLSRVLYNVLEGK